MLSLGPEYYSPIYYALVVFMSFLVFSQYEKYSLDHYDNAPRASVLGIVLFTLMIAVFIGLRPVSKEFFVDMEGYDDVYTAVQSSEYTVYETGNSVLFDELFLLFATHDIPAKYFFLFISLIYFAGIALACSLFFPNDRMASMLVYLSAFSTFSYATNGIKAGAAASLFLAALALYQRRQWLWTVLLALLSLGFHQAMVLPVGAFLVCLVVKNPKVFMGIWVVCFFLSIFHITYFQQIFSGMLDEHSASYLVSSGGHQRSAFFGGFRIDFVLYSVVPIVLGLIAIEKHKIESIGYVFILNLYTLANAIWMLCMYSDFTNRIAYLSWMLYPIVLIYPFLNEDWEGPKYKIFQWVAYGHLLFNLIMVFIYW